MNVESRLEARHLVLPAAVQPPSGVHVPFTWARIYQDRVYLSGHGPQNPDGSVAAPFGKVGAAVSPDQAANAARLATLSMLGSLKRAVGDLDRVAAWLTVSGMINVAPGFVNTTNVLTPCSELILELFGSEVGAHARTSIGMAQLPLDLPVVIAAEVAIR